MKFTEKGKVFEFIEYYFKDEIYKLLSVEEGRYGSYQIVYQFIDKFGEIVTTTFEDSEVMIDVLLRNLETENNKSKFIKHN